MRAMQRVAANVAKITWMMWRFNGEDSAEECFPLCCWLQHYANTDTSKMLFTIEAWKQFSCWEKYDGPLSDRTEDLIEMHDCYRQTWVQLLWIWSLKIPLFFKSEYKLEQSLMPNDQKEIQLYSSHFVVCPPSHLWLYTPNYNCFEPHILNLK